MVSVNRLGPVKDFVKVHQQATLYSGHRDLLFQRHLNVVALSAAVAGRVWQSKT